MKRFFAVLCQNNPVKMNVMGRILKPLDAANVPDMELVLVCRSKFGFKPDADSHVRVMEVDEDTARNDSKLKNHVLNRFFAEHNDGWLYMMDASNHILNANGFEKFFTELERMLDVFGMNAWLNTRTDAMNYVFERYNPRFTVLADDDFIKNALGTDTPVHWTSHANTTFMAVNLAEQNRERFLFDENLTIPMYYIVDWICRQKEENERLEIVDPSKPRWHWMNLYPTVESEGGLFVLADWKKLGLDESLWKEPDFVSEPSPADFEQQQQLFNEKKHDIAFTVNPDPAFTMMYNRFRAVCTDSEGNKKNA